MKPTLSRISLILLFLLLASPIRAMAPNVESLGPRTSNVVPYAPAEAASFFSYVEENGVAIYLSTLPCPAEVAKAGGLKPEYVKNYSSARVIVDDLFIQACYRPEGDNAYIIMLENGEHGQIPKAPFRPITKPTY